MKTIIIAIAALGLATPALAQAPAIDRNEAIFSAEGTKIGKVEKVVTGDDGAVAAVRIIYRGKFITIPALSSSGTRFCMNAAKSGPSSGMGRPSFSAR